MAKAKLESRVIYDNYGNDDYYLEAARESLAANCDNKNPTNDELQQEAWEIMRDDWDETLYDLRSFFDGGNWLAVGHVGRWDGCHDAGTTFTNWDWFIGEALKDCAYWRIEETARGHFILTGWHHDGDVQFEIKRLSEKGAAYLENEGVSRQAHQAAWKSNFMTSLPHYCRKVWGVGA